MWFQMMDASIWISEEQMPTWRCVFGLATSLMVLLPLYFGLGIKMMNVSLLFNRSLQPASCAGLVG
ncbi:hypothetical protein DBR42_05335 [Pelomonas sp. HMWF004]|nr:hypothetical protein DBR42_05335 [Pelomonas sp. HMWF004]